MKRKKNWLAVVTRGNGKLTTVFEATVSGKKERRKKERFCYKRLKQRHGIGTTGDNSNVEACQLANHYDTMAKTGSVILRTMFSFIGSLWAGT